MLSIAWAMPTWLTAGPAEAGLAPGLLDGGDAGRGPCCCSGGTKHQGVLGAEPSTLASQRICWDQDPSGPFSPEAAAPMLAWGVSTASRGSRLSLLPRKNAGLGREGPHRSSSLPLSYFRGASKSFPSLPQFTHFISTPSIQEGHNQGQPSAPARPLSQQWGEWWQGLLGSGGGRRRGYCKKSRPGL